MIEEKTTESAPPPYLTQNAPAARWQSQDTALRRFLGGSPMAVLLKLAVLSLVTGAVLVWLDIRPAEIFHLLTAFANHLYYLGFDAVREFGIYIGAGAAIVVPVWLVLRILSYRPAR
jgi:hypothetical protein